MPAKLLLISTLSQVLSLFSLFTLAFIFSAAVKPRCPYNSWLSSVSVVVLSARSEVGQLAAALPDWNGPEAKRETAAERGRERERNEINNTVQPVAQFHISQINKSSCNVSEPKTDYLMSLHDQKYVDTGTLHLHVIVEHLKTICMNTLLYQTPHFWNGFPHNGGQYGPKIISRYFRIFLQ